MNARILAGVVSTPAALLVLKATLVLSIACGVGSIARGLSAARRHLVFLIALGSCVALVISSPLLPAIVIHTPMVATPVVEGARDVTSPDESSYEISHSAARQDAVVSRGNQRAGRDNGPRLPFENHPLIAVWVIGCLGLTVRHALGVAGAFRLARRGSGEDMAAIVGARRRIRVCQSAEIQTPVTLGFVRPIILLPSEAASWSAETRRVVLLHELAHIERGDWLAQMVGRVGRDLFWFHPLAWVAFSRLCDAAERAADDCVLGAGVPATSYGAELLGIARRLAAPAQNVATVGMASRGGLEHRFKAIFDARRSRSAVTARHRATSAGASLLALIPFASIHISGQVQATETRPFTPPREWKPTIPLREASAPKMETQPVRAAEQRVEPVVVAAGPAQPQRATSFSGHPNLTGKWVPDTVAGAVVENFINDSTIISQSDQAISIESRGHVLDQRTHNLLTTLAFEGGAVRGLAVAGPDSTSFMSSARWYGDTLVINSRSDQGRNWQTIERLTLSADGNTLISENLSYVGVRYRFGGPKTFVLRRVTR